MARPARTVTAPETTLGLTEPEDLTLWSVTTIIGVLEKPALLYWAAEQTALAAIHSEATWRGKLTDDDPACQHLDATCDAVKWLRDARFRRPKGKLTAAERGTAVHEACENYALTGTRPQVEPFVTPYLDSFDDWLQRFQPSYQATEVAVYHPNLGYAGTCDAFLTIDETRFIVDYKTSEKTTDGRGKPTRPYPEQVGLQLAAYAHAEQAAVWRPRRVEKFRRRYYLLSPDEQALAQPVPEVDTGLVIHITPKTCDAYPIDVGRKAFDGFLAALDLFRWSEQDSRTVMGHPLTPAPKEGDR